ncbi:MAG TPA: cupin domain-containing protein [Pseudolabrys sp.]|nr:cupin domain-containing protein [Pseudolabrys sp.]HZT24094.1 cupin domain-containing protein [Pseudolabrys sp.]
MRDVTDIQATRPGSNLLAEFDQVFVRDVDIPKTPIRSAEGVAFDKANVSVKLLMVADRMHMLKVFFTKGSVVPVHVHNDHSTICCLQEGKLKLNIGGKTFIAEPGDVWQHPRGVPHNHEALEDSYVVEIKSPAVKTW